MSEVPSAATPPPGSFVPLFATTTFDIPGYRIERSIGLCWGVVVRSVGIARGVSGAFRALAPGEVPEFTGVVSEARGQAEQRMMEHARAIGANAVVGVRFDSADISDGLSEIVAYGTAVVAVPE